MTRFVPILVLSLAACGGDDDKNTRVDFGDDASAAYDAAKPRLTEPQSAEVVLSLDSGEVQVASAVVNKLTGGDIRSFANQMIAAHTQAKKDAMTLFAAQSIIPETNASSMALDDSASMVATQLSSEATPDHDYINSQVVMHAQALMLVDCVVEPSVQNAAFSSMLKTMRAAIADHLAMAKMLGGTGSAPGPDAGASDCASLCTTAGGLPDALRNALCM